MNPHGLEGQSSLPKFTNMCSWLFLLLASLLFLGPITQLPNNSHMDTSQFDLFLAISSYLLPYIYLLPLGVYISLLFIPFLLLSPWLAMQLGSWSLTSSLIFLSFIHLLLLDFSSAYLFSACQACLSCLGLCDWPFFSLLDEPGLSDRQSNTNSQS